METKAGETGVVFLLFAQKPNGINHSALELFS